MIAFVLCYMDSGTNVGCGLHGLGYECRVRVLVTCLSIGFFLFSFQRFSGMLEYLKASSILLEELSAYHVACEKFELENMFARLFFQLYVTQFPYPFSSVSTQVLDTLLKDPCKIAQ